MQKFSLSIRKNSSSSLCNISVDNIEYLSEYYNKYKPNSHCHSESEYEHNSITEGIRNFWPAASGGRHTFSSYIPSVLRWSWLS